MHLIYTRTQRAHITRSRPQSLLDAVADVLLSRLDGLSHHEVATALWTFGTFRHRPAHPDFAKQVAAALYARMRSFSPQVCWAPQCYGAGGCMRVAAHVGPAAGQGQLGSLASLAAGRHDPVVIMAPPPPPPPLPFAGPGHGSEGAGAAAVAL